MKFTPEIISIAFVALTTGFVVGYGVRSFVSYLRRRRARGGLGSMQSRPGQRMEPQNDRDWRTDLECDLSLVTMAPPDDPGAPMAERRQMH
jgi:hypothetical protein